MKIFHKMTDINSVLRIFHIYGNANHTTNFSSDHIGFLIWFCIILFTNHFITSVSDGRGKDYESVLVAQFIHAYASEEYGETTETNKTNKHKQLGSKGLMQTINIVIYTLSMSNNQTPLWLPMA